MKWEAAQGWAVEYLEIIGAPRPSAAPRRAPTPLEGAQFAVTRHGFLVGYTRTEAGLTRLGVPETLIAAIRRTVRRGA
jgi:hypothetical protein